MLLAVMAIFYRILETGQSNDLV